MYVKMQLFYLPVRAIWAVMKPGDLKTCTVEQFRIKHTHTHTAAIHVYKYKHRPWRAQDNKKKINIPVYKINIIII